MPLDTSPDTPETGVGNKPIRQAIDIHVGARLSRRRKELGFCQERLGQEMELNEATIRSFESGYTRVGPQNLLRLSQVLNTTIGFFYSD